MAVALGSRAAALLFVGLGACEPPVYVDPLPLTPSYDLSFAPPARVSGGDGVLTGSCPGGSRQTCYPGPAGTENIGTCRPGVQECSNVEGPSTWGPCLGAVLPAEEKCVAGRVDDTNCDGMIDMSACCPKDSIFTFILSGRPPVSNSAVVPGGPWALLAVLRDCSAPISCKPSELVLDSGVTQRCMPALPSCKANEALYYDGTDANPTGWNCVPCAVVVEFGSLFNGRRICADAPALSCPNGQVPTFDANSLTWICAPQCDNGTYDLHSFGGQIICVPC